MIAGVTSLDLDLISSITSQGSQGNDRGGSGLDGLTSSLLFATNSSRPLSPASSNYSGDENIPHRAPSIASSNSTVRETSPTMRLSPSMQLFLKSIPNLSYMLAPPGVEDAME